MFRLTVTMLALGLLAGPMFSEGTKDADKSKDEAKPDEKAMTYIDPSRLPPSYRGPIEKYFQKLSEKK